MPRRLRWRGGSAGPDPAVQQPVQPEERFESWMPPEHPAQPQPPAEGEAPREAGAPLDALEAAVHEYCQALLPADEADGAAADSMEAFRELSASGEHRRGEMLAAVTRLMTAVSMPDRSLPADRRRAVRASLGSESRSTCRETAVLLATAANGTIQPRERRALSAHLAACADCRRERDRIAAAEGRLRAAVERDRIVEPAMSPPIRPGALGGWTNEDVVPWAAETMRELDALQDAETLGESRRPSESESG